jgi:ABC-type multidrug transport system fused ATPase/permease subunit
MGYVRIPYTKYNWEEPGILSENAFWRLKDKLTQDPNLDLRPYKVEKFDIKLYIYIFTGFTLFLFIDYLLATILPYSYFTNILAAILNGGIYGLFFFFISFLISAFNYWNYASSFNSYYSNLKRMVTEANTYKDYLDEFPPIMLD